MGPFLAMLVVASKAVLLCLLALAAVVGAIGAASPRALATLAAAGNRWVDTWHFFRVPETSLVRRLDKWIELDGLVLRHSRAFGIALLAAALLLGSFYLGWL